MITPISLYFSRGFCLPPKPCGKAKEIIVRCPAIIILASCFCGKKYINVDCRYCRPFCIYPPY